MIRRCLVRCFEFWLMDLRLQGYEPFVSFEGLDQLHRFLFILGITHVLYSFVTVVLSMIKVLLLFLCTPLLQASHINWC